MSKKDLISTERAVGQPLKAIAGTPDKPLVINDVQLPCYVLEGGIRVLSQRGLQTGVGLSPGGGRELRRPRLVTFFEILEKKGVDTSGLGGKLENPLVFKSSHGGITHGYNAEIINDICEVVLDAQSKKQLEPNQDHIAKRCEALLRGLARVGINALIDEATGYQDVRTKRALAEILERFLSNEARAWTKTFPLKFYREMYRLLGWKWIELEKGKKPPTPQVVAKFTDNLVYKRLAPNVLKELRAKNPMTPEGYRRHRHHQWFNESEGLPALKEHVSKVILLMAASKGGDWEDFLVRLERALPLKWPHGTLFYRDDDDKE